jgi:phosphate transport system substrate-binding protein
LAALGMSGCAGCNGGGGGGGPDATRLTGGGSSFIAPLFTKKWIGEYKKAKEVEIDYNSIGSSAGIGKMANDEIDFGATDAPMSPDEFKAAGGEDKVLHIPLVMGAVAVVYHLDGVKDLKLEGPVLADIFLGHIDSWNDPRIKERNHDADLPDEKISVVYRADGSGTSYIFSDYLSTVSDEWKKDVGRNTLIKLPKGQAIAKSSGMAQTVKDTKGAIGYVELSYTLQNPNDFGVALVQNGEKSAFVKPSVEGVVAAAENAKLSKEDLESLRFSIVGAPGKDSYPISGTTWAVVKVKQPADKVKPLKDFFHWAVKDGQEAANEMQYGPLPKGVVEATDKRIDQIAAK